MFSTKMRNKQHNLENCNLFAVAPGGKWSLLSLSSSTCEFVHQVPLFVFGIIYDL